MLKNLEKNVKSQCGGKRLSIVLPIMLNKVLIFSSNIAMKDFKEHIYMNFSKFILTKTH